MIRFLTPIMSGLTGCRVAILVLALIALRSAGIV